MADTERTPLLVPDGITTVPPSERSEDNSGQDASDANPERSIIRYTVLPVLFVGVFMCQMDETIVFASGNVIASEFSELSRAGWLVTSYTLSICAVQPIYGRFGEELGRKKVLLWCYIVFSAGCLLCTLGTSYVTVVLGRVVTGFGSAGMNSLALIITTDFVEKREVALWRSVLTLTSTVGRSIGGPLGGLFTDKLSWRWSFGLQIPVVLVAFLLVLWRLPSHSPSSPKKKSSTLSRLDFAGAFLTSSTITTFLAALMSAGAASSFAIPGAASLGAISFVLGVAFVLVEKRRPDIAIFPIYLITNPDVYLAWILVILQYSASFAVNFSVPLYYQVTRNISTRTAGFYLVPGIFGNLIGSISAGYFVWRTGRYKAFTLSGMGISLVGYVLIIIRWQGNESIWELLYAAFCHLGQAAVSTIAFLHLTAALPSKDLSIAGIGSFTCHNIGASAGVSVATAVLQHTLVAQLRARLPDTTDKNQIIAKSKEDLLYVQSLTGKTHDIVVGSYVKSLTWMHVVSLVLAVLSFVSGILLREHRL